MRLDYTVTDEENGKQLKYILKQKLQLSERLVKKLKYDNKVFLNSLSVYVNTPVKTGDYVEVLIDFLEDDSEIQPEDIEIDIIYEDDSLIVVNKKPFIVVHPTFNHPRGTVANAIMHHYVTKGDIKKVRPVSRLDKDTSGIIIFAKNQFIQESLIRQMKDNIFKKEYLGVLSGIPSPLKGTIDLPIERKPDSIMLRHISPTGAPSVTHYEVLEELKDSAFVKFVLETGRTHQIRVHCQAIGHPLIGDTLYSDIESQLINRQALHSFRTSIVHPLTGESVIFTAHIPEDIKNLINASTK